MKKFLKWALIVIVGLTVFMFSWALIDIILINPEKYEKLAEEREKTEAAEAVKEEAEAAAEKIAEANKQAAEEKAEAAELAAKKLEMITKPVAAYQNETMGLMAPCEKASQDGVAAFVKATKGQINAFDAYGTIKGMEPVCERAAKALANMKIPRGLPDKIKKSLVEAKPYCFGAASTRSEGMSIMLRILDGEVKPSIIAELDEKGELVQGATLRCVAGLVSAAVEAGVEKDELK